jgi:hypothetical protein
MKTYTFIKKKGQWFLNLPLNLREFNETTYTHVENAGGALDEMASGENQLSLSMDVKPLKSALVLELEGFPTADGVEGFYQLRNNKGLLLKNHLPLSDLSLLLYGELPEHIYLRQHKA